MNMPYRPIAGQRGLIVAAGSEHGVARRCARRASALGARLALVCPPGAAAGDMAALAAQVGAALQVCNIDDRRALASTVRSAVERTGAFDFVVHSNDGAACHGPHRDDACAIEAYFRLLQRSCRSFTELARQCAPHMPRGATLVHIDNLQVPDAESSRDLVRTVRAVLQSIVRYLELELGPWGLHVHLVSHGAMQTRPTSAPSVIGDPELGRGGGATLAPYIAAPDLVGDCLALLAGAGATGMIRSTRDVRADAHAPC